MDAQYKKGVLDLCVLSQLIQEDRYGYQTMVMLKHIWLNQPEDQPENIII